MSDEKPETPEEIQKRRLAEISRLSPDRRVQALKELATKLAKHEKELREDEMTTQQQTFEAEELTKQSEEEVATLERLLPKQESVKVEDVLRLTQVEAKKAEDKVLEEHVQEAAKEVQHATTTEHPYADVHKRSNDELYARFKDLRDQLRESQYTRNTDQGQEPGQEQRQIVYEMQQIGQEAHYRGTQEQGKISEQHGMISALEEWASKYNN